MKSIFTSLCSLGVLAVAAGGLGACSSSNADFIGTWTATTPVIVQDSQLRGLSAQPTLDFASDSQKDGGQVSISARLEAIATITTDTTVTVPYDVTVSGSATVSGNWSYDIDDKDDILLSFDGTTLSINALT